MRKSCFLRNGSKLKQVVYFQRKRIVLVFEIVKLVFPLRAYLKINMHFFRENTFTSRSSRVVSNCLETALASPLSTFSLDWCKTLIVLQAAALWYVGIQSAD